MLYELLQRRIAPLRWPMMKSARNEGDVMMAAEMITSRDERKKVEMRFAHLKVHHHFERMMRSRRSSMRGETAVDRQADPDHEARGRAAQPQHSGSDLIGPAETAD